MRRLAFGHIAANVVRRAKFAAANLDHGVPHLRLEPDAGPVPVDLHIANHERAGPNPGRRYSAALEGMKPTLPLDSRIRSQSPVTPVTRTCVLPRT